MAMTKVQQVRFPDEEKLAVKRAAQKAGLTMSAWLRSRAIIAARAELAPQPPVQRMDRPRESA